jgi:hypothetical protein
MRSGWGRGQLLPMRLLPRQYWLLLAHSLLHSNSLWLLLLLLLCPLLRLKSRQLQSLLLLLLLQRSK